MSDHPDRVQREKAFDGERDPAQEDQKVPGGAGRKSGLTPSTAPNNAFDSGAGSSNTGFDSPPVTSQYFGNPPAPNRDFPNAYDSTEHADELEAEWEQDRKPLKR